MKSFSFKKLFENDRVIVVLSILAACFCWLLVVTTNNTKTNQTIRGVPVDLEIQSTAVSAMGLNVIEGGDTKVDVTVYGDRSVIGQLKPEDLHITARMSDVVGQGTYDLEVRPVTTDSDFEYVQFSPGTIRIKFDQLVTRKFKIEQIINGISVSPGYILDQQQQYANPAEVEITGPKVELDKIDKCVVVAELEEPLEKSYVTDLPIQLWDANGNTINSDDKHLTINHSESQLVIPVLKYKEMPLVVEYLNVPSGFPLEELSPTLSDEIVELAGPAGIIDALSEIRLGYIDMKYLDLDRASYTFDLEMPSTQFVNLDNINSVTVTFDLEDFSESYFNITDIKMVNIPNNFDIKLVSTYIYNVKFVGDPEVLRNLSAGDIVAEIDFSQRTVTTGQYKVPVNVSVPSKGLVWAVGDQSAVIQVTEK
ncbi:hypothetical protein U6B65_01265 [Oscillospiraceae bacterium MB08-C2-2]|nr:hypothetical protein U6B65_01265 [Oscillospiraceae bacterium MB08-C2-2]